jgi:hypothetical protein
MESGIVQSKFSKFTGQSLEFALQCKLTAQIWDYELVLVLSFPRTIVGSQHAVLLVTLLTYCDQSVWDKEF